MKKINWKAKLIVLFIFLSFSLYCIHFLIFKDEIYIYRILISQLAFLPLSTLLVTFVLNELLGRRRKKELIQKLNMVIGSFFSEVANEVLAIIPKYKLDLDKEVDMFKFSEEWTKKDFFRVKNIMKEKDVNIDFDVEALKILKEILSCKRNFVLSLLQNPNLLEHQSFTDLLWSVFHLTEELAYRENLNDLSEDDIEHLSKDISRMYKNLILEWISYMQHLQIEYPYLYSLAIRINPLNENTTVEF